jgi:hypothetical protein
MKKITAVCILLITAAVFGFADTGELDVYARIYNSAAAQEEKLGILQTIIEEQLNGAGKFYADVLHSLVAGYQNIRGATEQGFAHEQLIILAAQVGAENQTAAAADLWRIVEQFQNSPAVALVKAEALMSLGRLQAKAFIPQMIKYLHDLNIKAIYPNDNLSRERVAYGAIIGLEKMADPAAYLVVYETTKAGYLGRITNQATKSLPVVSSDPGPQLTSIIRDPGKSYADKLIALQSIDDSNLPNDQKAAAAVAALAQVWFSITQDVRQLSNLREIRTQGMDMITKYGTQDAAVPPLLKRSYSDQPDMNEKLSAIAALGKIGTDDAARFLTDLLSGLNTKQKDGSAKQDENRLVRAVIPALGAAKKALARPELSNTKTAGWGGDVNRLADEALRQIPAN